MSKGAGQDIPLNAINRHVGRAVRARRQLVQMSEQWLADFLEISTNHLRDMEEGRTLIGTDLLVKIAEVIGVPERYFYQGLGEHASEHDRNSRQSSWIRDVDHWFKDQVAPHEGLFLKVAQRMLGNWDAAHDLVHDAYAKVLADDRWRTIENAKIYVRQTVSSLALNQIKRQKIVPMDQYADMEMIEMMDTTPDALQTVVDRERLRAVMKAIGKLPKACQRVFVMRRIEDMAPAQIAEKLGLTMGSVEVYHARAMQALHRHLENQQKNETLNVWLTTHVSPKDQSRPEVKRK